MDREEQKTYICPMHPEVRSGKPGRCPECGMSLVKMRPAKVGMNTETNSSATPFLKGLVAALVPLSIYFAVLTFVSGWQFAESQFAQFWYFIVSLALGFGIQFGLYTRLKYLLRHRDPSGKVMAATGTTSTAAMVSCCTHYLANILPILGATGIVAVVAQYQVKFFWLGLVLNAAGIIFIARRIVRIKHQ